MPLSVLLMLLALPVLLVCSGFFSGSETALFSLSRHQRTQLARSTGVTAATITTLLSETRSLLITLLLGNMIINVLYINTCSLLMLRLSRIDWVGPTAATLFNVVPLVGIIMFGEVLPKLVAARLTLTWSRVIALPLLLVHRVLAPIRIFSYHAIITPLARLIEPRQSPDALSPEELESLLTLSQHQGVIDSDEEGLLQHVLQLGRLKVRDLMTPRVDIVAFDSTREPSELMQLLRETRLRHIPVYENELDNIVGLIHARQVLVAQPETREALHRFIRQVRFVPEQQRADQFLVEMRKSGMTFAIVVDEYGGTAGLITLEDVVEHVVGNIPGEYETGAEPQLEQLGPDRWRAGADLSVQAWADLFAHARQRPPESVRTIGGLVMARLGRAPAEGDAIEVGNVIIRVERTDGARVETVTIELKQRRGATRQTEASA